MSAVINGKEYVVTATAVNLTSILGLGRQFFSIISLRAGETNVGTTYIGKSNVTVTTNRLGYLLKQESVSIDMTKSFFSSDDIYIIGTPGDILHVWFWS